MQIFRFYEKKAKLALYRLVAHSTMMTTLNIIIPTPASTSTKLLFMRDLIARSVDLG